MRLLVEGAYARAHETTSNYRAWWQTSGTKGASCEDLHNDDHGHCMRKGPPTEWLRGIIWLITPSVPMSPSVSHFEKPCQISPYSAPYPGSPPMSAEYL
jgi:hypothetical protein